MVVSEEDHRKTEVDQRKKKLEGRDCYCSAVVFASIMANKLYTQTAIRSALRNKPKIFQQMNAIDEQLERFN